MLRRSACGMKRSVFAALSAQPAAGARSKAAATSAPAKRVFAAMQALDRPGIDPPVLLFSEGDLTRSEGKAKTPANSMRPLGLARAVPDAPARRAREGAPRDEATEIGEYRPSADQPQPSLRPIASPRVRHGGPGGPPRGERQGADQRGHGLGAPQPREQLVRDRLLAGRADQGNARAMSRDQPVDDEREIVGRPLLHRIASRGVNADQRSARSAIHKLLDL